MVALKYHGTVQSKYHSERVYTSRVEAVRTCNVGWNGGFSQRESFYKLVGEDNNHVGQQERWKTGTSQVRQDYC